MSPNHHSGSDHAGVTARLSTRRENNNGEYARVQSMRWRVRENKGFVMLVTRNGCKADDDDDNYDRVAETLLLYPS